MAQQAMSSGQDPRGRSSTPRQRLQVKQPLDLIRLLQQVPAILSVLSDRSLRVLLSTSSCLRNQVHSFATSIKFCPEPDAQLLVSGHWPSLQKLQVVGPIFAATMQQLCHNSWQNLTTLNLEGVFLDLPGLQHLAQGSWPSMVTLHLPNNNLHGERMVALQQANWPKLKHLDLWSCNMNCASVAHLIAAPWDQLEMLDIGLNYFTAADVKQLSRGRWPQLRTLSLDQAFCNQVKDAHGRNKAVEDADGNQIGKLDSAFMMHVSSANWPNLQALDLSGMELGDTNIELLAQCRWPMLSSLMLGKQELTAKGCAHLAQATWPLMESMELCKAGIDTTGMLHLVSANWSMLRALDLSWNALDIAACAHLAKGLWPQLKRLCLHGCTVTTAGMRELTKGRWPELQVLDFACLGFDHHGLRYLLDNQCTWTKLECLELLYGQYTDLMIGLLSPGNRACLGCADNLIDDASLIAGGKWPRLQMLDFSHTVHTKFWFHQWGKVDTRSFDYNADKHELGCTC